MIKSQQTTLVPDIITNNQLAHHMASFFLEMTEFCIEQLNIHLKPKIPKVVGNNQINEEIAEKQVEKLNSKEENREKVVKQSKKFGTKKKNFENKPYFLQMKPKAPVSSYLLFLHQNKADISTRNHITNVSDVTKLASIEWKRLSEEEREKYCTQSQVQKNRYKEEMKVYTQKYASQIKQYKRLKQIAYKSKWLENKSKKTDPQVNHYRQLKIQNLKKKLKATIEENKTITNENISNDSSKSSNSDSKQLEIDFSDSNSI